jgi:hypothetical protein
MISSRAWYLLGVCVVLGLLYVGLGLRDETASHRFLGDSAVVAQEPAKKEAILWYAVPSRGMKSNSEIHRAKVLGGWLVFVSVDSPFRANEFTGSGLTFVPDPDHRWDGVSAR